MITILLYGLCLIPIFGTISYIFARGINRYNNSNIHQSIPPTF